MKPATRRSPRRGLSLAWIARLLLVGASAAGAGVLRKEGGVWEGGVRDTLLTRAELLEVRTPAARTACARDCVRCTLHVKLRVCASLRATHATRVVVIGWARCVGEPSHPDIRACFRVRARARGPSEWHTAGRTRSQQRRLRRGRRGRWMTCRTTPAETFGGPRPCCPTRGPRSRSSTLALTRMRALCAFSPSISAHSLQLALAPSLISSMR